MPDSFETNIGDVWGILRARLDDVAGHRLFDEVLKVYRKDAIRWEGDMTKSLNGPLSLGAPKSASASLASRTGLAGLKGSFGTAIKHSGTLESLEIRKFSTSPYAVTHELGTRSAGGSVDIRPKNAKALTIPLPDAMTASGVPRQPNARSWPDTFVYSTPERTGDVLGYIVQEDPAQPGELIFLYLLFRGAPKIPARLGMRKTHRAAEKKRQEGILEAIRIAFRGGKGGPKK